jgi:DNA-binding transcriptional regulator GbsR (MarR family)
MDGVKFSPAEQQFLERFTELGVASGLARSTARVYSYLIICRPPEQTATNIQAALGLSAGSVSTATTLLTRVGLIEMIKKPGDRHIYYEFQPEGLVRATEQRFKTVTAAKDIAANALKDMPGNERMVKVHETYSIFEELVAEFLKHLKNKQK